MTNQQIQTVIQALNTLQVSGSQNLNTLLGCIQYLQQHIDKTQIQKKQTIDQQEGE